MFRRIVALLAVATLVACADEAPPPVTAPQPPPTQVVAPPPPPPPPPPPAYVFVPGNYPTGHNEIIHNATDPQACARACDQNPACWVATFHDATVQAPYTSTCALRPFVGQHVDAQAGIQSWVKPGTPPPPPVVVERVVVNEGRIKLNEEILFKTGSAEIDPKSDDFILYLARILRDHDGLDFVEVAGHADQRGGAADNVKLTQARADAVAKHLAADGVNPKRLRGVGYGAYCPLDPANNEDAWKKNRRVEFVILRRNGHDLRDKWDGCDAARAAGMKPLAIPASAPKTKEWVVKKAKIIRKGFDLVFSDQVRFEPRTANIVPATEPALDALRVFLDKDKSVTKIRVEGHTDPPNTPEMLALSQARSKKVAEWLVAHGIAPNRILPVGCGGSRPVMNGAAVDEQRSRRTEAHVVEENGKPVNALVPPDCAVD